MAKCRPVKCCVSPFFVRGSRCLCICGGLAEGGRQQMPVPVPRFRIVQTVHVQGENWPPSAIGGSPAESPPLCCLTTAEPDPFYLFIYLLHYLLIPSLVWPFNDPPGGTGEMERSLQGQMTIHFIYRENKSKCNNTMGLYTVCAGEVRRTEWMKTSYDFAQVTFWHQVIDIFCDNFLLKT